MVKYKLQNQPKVSQNIVIVSLYWCLPADLSFVHNGKFPSLFLNLMSVLSALMCITLTKISSEALGIDFHSYFSLNNLVKFKVGSNLYDRI